MGIDATTTESLGVIHSKLGKTADRLRRNSLTEVKYFKDEDAGREPGPINVPRVVIGVNREEVRGIQNSIARDRTYQLEEKLRDEIVDEIKIQLTKAACYLLENFYSRKTETPIDTPEGIIEFFNRNAENIKKQNQTTYENVLKHIEALKYLIKLANKKSPSDLNSSAGGGVLARTVRGGHFFQ